MHPTLPHLEPRLVERRRVLHDDCLRAGRCRLRRAGNRGHVVAHCALDRAGAVCVREGYLAAPADDVAQQVGLKKGSRRQTGPS